MCLAWPVGWSGSLDRRLREVIGTGIQSVRDCDAAALGTVALLLALFLWYCYQVGREQPQPPPQPRPYCAPLPAAKALLLLPGAAAKEEEEGLAPNGCYYAPCPSGPGGGGGVLHQRLYRHLQEYAKRYSWSGMGRIHKAIREQGRRPRRARPPSIQRPEVFFLPDLPSAPYFAREAQRHDVELLERNFQTIAGEFEALYQAFSGVGGVIGGGLPSPPPPPPPPGWKAHRTPTGQWLTFPLVRQGACVPRNCRRCPRTFRLLGSLRTCIGNNVFGNAGLSLLMPGTVVAEHYGPTNIRLRCHLGLKTPSNCELVVGGEPQCWAEGRCLLFDDSFLHTAFHGGPPEEGPHAVFMVDLWHPNVAAAERQALDFIFAPGR